MIVADVDSSPRRVYGTTTLRMAAVSKVFKSRGCAGTVESRAEQSARFREFPRAAATAGGARIRVPAVWRTGGRAPTPESRVNQLPFPP
jgi:hypothetical protein